MTLICKDLKDKDSQELLDLIRKMSHRIVLILNVFEFERLCDKVDVLAIDDMYVLNDIEEKIFKKMSDKAIIFDNDRVKGILRKK